MDGGWTTSYHRPMPMWRCPHCATPQAEAARCWVCHRSNSGCSSCRNFRNSISAGVGYCALDRGRTALNGQEIRPCWEPVIGLTGGSGAPQASGDMGGPALIAVETLVGADIESGCLWRDAEL